MPNRFVNGLFQLIHFLERNEKRSFNLYRKRYVFDEERKMIQLFDALGKRHDYIEPCCSKTSCDQKTAVIEHQGYKQISTSSRLLP